MRTAILLVLLWAGVASADSLRTAKLYEMSNFRDKSRLQSKLRNAIQILLGGNPGGLGTIEINDDLADRIRQQRNAMMIEVAEIQIEQREKKTTKGEVHDKLDRLIDQQLAAYRKLFTAENNAKWMQGFHQACWRLNDHDWLAEHAEFVIPAEEAKLLRENARRNHGAYDEAFASLERIVGATKAIELIGEELAGVLKPQRVKIPGNFQPERLVADWLKMRADVERARIETNKRSPKRSLVLGNLRAQIIHARANRKRMEELFHLSRIDIPRLVSSSPILFGRVESVIDGDTIVLSTRSYASMALYHSKHETHYVLDTFFGTNEKDYRNADESLKERHIPARDVVIRLADIDAPELDQPYGKEARDALRDLCEGRFVICEMTSLFNPVVVAENATARVLIERRLPGSVAMQTSLFDSGLAWMNTPHARAMLRVDQDQAIGDFGKPKLLNKVRASSPDFEFQKRIGSPTRAMGGGLRRDKFPNANVVQSRIGLWRDPDPIAPWNWRAEHRFVAGDAKRPDQIRYLVSEQLPESQFELLAARLVDKLQIENAIVSFYTSRPHVMGNWTEAVDPTTKHHVGKAVFHDGTLAELKSR